MAGRVDLIVENGTVVTSEETFGADLAIKDGKFAAIAAPGQLAFEAEKRYDASGQYVLPGVVDGHVHFREPGWEYKEDFGTGSTAAVMGGVTTVLDMPNTKPPTDTPENFEVKRRLAEEKSRCDFGILGLVVQENVDQLEPLAKSGVAGYKCFLGETVGNIPAPDDGMLLEAMRAIRRTGLRVGFHAENNAIMQHLIRKLKAEGPRKGDIRVGSDGDLTIVDLEKAGVIRETELHGRNNMNPFEGHKTRGQAVATIVRGQIVMRDGELVGDPIGRLVSPVNSAEEATSPA